MKRTTLLIMAAGIGSRFGNGIKQFEPVGINDEIIMDYSIHDAIEAGYNKIVIVLRKDIYNDFVIRIGNRIETICKVNNVEISYVFQDINNVPKNVPEGRIKPWGTGQAVLAAKEIIRGPFAVINADDYYGKDAFNNMHEWLVGAHDNNDIAMCGFILKNTLSDNGGVTRGVCKVSNDCSNVIDIVETGNIVKKKTSDSGKIEVEANEIELDQESYVSMNFWGFPAEETCIPEYFNLLEKGFEDFFANDVVENPLKSEFLLPIHIGGLMKNGICSVKLLKTNDKWFGVTYKEDKEIVKQSFKKLIEDGIYKEDLYSDLL